MHDLRKKALLESGKTTSRKSRSKDHTPLSSKRNTPAGSRNPSRLRGGSSRGGSDHEDDSDNSDETSPSTGSLDNMNPDSLALDSEVAERVLGDLIDEILARKGSTNKGRERSYKAFVDILRAHYQYNIIEHREEELIAAFLKSVKEATSEKETLMALKAIEMTIVTSPSETVFETIYPQLKRTVTDYESITVNVAAIHTLGLCTFYGGASDHGNLEVMDWLLEIVTSDGASVSALDEPSIVAAACEEWSLLCTLLDDVEAESETYMDTFVDQLHSNNAAVKIAAGEAIAQLHEKSYRPIDDDDDVEIIESDRTIKHPYSRLGQPKLYRMYNFYHDTDSLLDIFNDLARNVNLSVHSINRSDRKALKTAFTDLYTSIQNPHHGPHFSTAYRTAAGSKKPLKDDYESDHGGEVERDDAPYGSRLTVKIGASRALKIDQYWKLHRLNALKRVLKGGFVTHYQENDVLEETIPWISTTRSRAK